MSQSALAEAVGVTFQQIHKVRTCGSNRISFSRLVDVAHALDFRVVDMIGDLDDAGKPSPPLPGGHGLLALNPARRSLSQPTSKHLPSREGAAATAPGDRQGAENKIA